MATLASVLTFLFVCVFSFIVVFSTDSTAQSKMTADNVLIPILKWAQDKEYIFATITVPDLEKADVKLEEKSLSFT